MITVSGRYFGSTRPLRRSSSATPRGRMLRSRDSENLRCSSISSVRSRRRAAMTLKLAATSASSSPGRTWMRWSRSPWPILSAPMRSAPMAWSRSRDVVMASRLPKSAEAAKIIQIEREISRSIAT